MSWAAGVKRFLINDETLGQKWGVRERSASL